MYDPNKECKEMIEAIKSLCAQKNMTPHALAKKAGISTSTMSYLLNGKTKPQVYTVLVLCNVLGVRISDLLDNNVAPAETSELIAQYVTYDEKNLLDIYRKLSDKKKELLKVYIDMLQQYEDALLVEK